MSNRDIIAAHYASAARGDLEGMLAPMADEMEWTEMAGFPTGGTYHGPKEITDKVFAAMDGGWDGFKVEIDELLESGDSVVAIGQYSGTNRETGKQMRVRVVHRWRLRDGKAVSFEQFADTHLFREAMS